MTTVAPVLSTPAEHILEAPIPLTAPAELSRLTEEQLYIQYEIPRTIREIREGRWKKIALQFPDEMLVDAPRVFKRLRDGLKKQRSTTKAQKSPEIANTAEGVNEQLKSLKIHKGVTSNGTTDEGDVEERLCILADTSYGACCVDEVAAEHVDADCVVHYGRACLSPTARLPVIYVFTTQHLDVEAAVTSFMQTYTDKTEKVCLMADIPYTHHISALHSRLDAEGYSNIFATEVVRDPAALLPNRTLPPDVQENPERLKDYSIFYLSNPPTSLLLILSTRIKGLHIFPTTSLPPSSLTTTSTTALLRRRYAFLLRLSSAPIIGILINTLSVSNYMEALTHCQTLIANAGKKSHVFVVGKINPAKLANFAEIGGWVVIGCWESSLIDSKDFYAPIVTPFELEVALRGDQERMWNGEWVGDFSALLGKDERVDAPAGHANGNGDGEGNWNDQESDDEPPDFDLRTGRYVSRSRPMGRPKQPSTALVAGSSVNGASEAPPSSALVQRARGDVAAINGTLSPAADFLRSQRTWQGLGSDYSIAYERDEDGRIRGAAMEEGRKGVAKGYSSSREEEVT